MSNNNIFILWFGKEYKLIKEYRNILYKKCSHNNIHFITEDNLDEYFNDNEIELDKLEHIAHKADIIRVYCLLKYGGIWLDSDTLVINNLDYYFNLLNDNDGFLIYEEKNLLCNGFLGFNKNSLFLKDYYRQIKKVLKEKDYNINWCDIGSNIINNIIGDYDNIELINAYEDIYKIDWRKCVDILTQPISYELIKYFDVKQDLLITVNSLYKHIEKYKDYKNKNMLLNYFINKANSIKYEFNNNKVLIYSNWIKDYITNEHYELVLELEKLGWQILDLKDLGNTKLNNCIVLLVTYDSYRIDNLLKGNNYIIYKIDDLYTSNKEHFNLRLHNSKYADSIIGPYTYLFEGNKYYNDFKDKVFNIPYSIPEKNILDIQYNDNPKNKILISGYKDDNIIPYSFSYKISLIAENNNDLEILENYGNNKKKHNITNNNYIKILNEYLCCFTCCLDYKYLVLKHYEIISSGSLLLCDISIEEQLNKLGFYNMKNCIMINKKDNIYKSLLFILDENNKDIINRIRLNGYELSKKHYTKFRAERINKLFQLNK